MGIETDPFPDDMEQPECCWLCDDGEGKCLYPLKPGQENPFWNNGGNTYFCLYCGAGDQLHPDAFPPPIT